MLEMNIPIKIQEGKNLALIVSVLTNPVILIIASIGVVANHYAQTSEQFWKWTVYSSFLIVGPAIVFSLFRSIRKREIDIDISKREDRIIPLMLSTLGAFYVSYLINTRLNDQQTLVLLSRSLVGMMLFLTLMTMVWKVSLHTAAMSAVITLLSSYLGNWYALLYFLIVIVGWARIYLKRHSLAQVIGGTGLGVLISYLAVVLFKG